MNSLKRPAFPILRCASVWLLSFLLAGCFKPEGGDDENSGVSVKVRSETRIASDRGGFDGSLADGDGFGSAVAAIGDLGGSESLVFGDLAPDGVDDLAAGAPGDSSGRANAGAVWLLFMDADGKVAHQRRITTDKGGFTGNLDADDRFGSAITLLPDLDGDGIDELAVGAPGDDDRGAVWVLFMEAGGRVRDDQKISDGRGDLDSNLRNGDGFGSALATVTPAQGDFNADGIADLLVGLPGRGGSGAVWMLYLDSTGRVINKQRISESHGEFRGDLDDGDRFGSAIAVIGDLDGDGVADLAVGAPGDDDGRNGNPGDERGAVWILFMNSDGTVRKEKKISDNKGRLRRDLHDGDRFGSAIAPLGDLDGDGFEDIAVGAPGRDSSTKGTLWILFLKENGEVRSRQRIGYRKGGFDGRLHDGDRFGAAVANIGNFDAERSTDLAVGAPGDDTGGQDRGAAWLLYLNDPK